MAIGEQKVQRRKSTVLKAVSDLLRERGYAAVTISEIAIKCDVAASTLYNRFGSKGGLVAEASHEFYKERLVRADEIASEPGLPRVLALVESLIEGVNEDPAFVHEIHKAYSGLEDGSLNPERLPDTARMLTAAFAERLAEMGAQGEMLPDAEPMVIAETLVSALTGVMRLWSFRAANPEGGALLVRRAILLPLLAVSTGAAQFRLERMVKPLLRGGVAFALVAPNAAPPARRAGSRQSAGHVTATARTLSPRRDTGRGA